MTPANGRLIRSLNALRHKTTKCWRTSVLSEFDKSPKLKDGHHLRSNSRLSLKMAMSNPILPRYNRKKPRNLKIAKPVTKMIILSTALSDQSAHHADYVSTRSNLKISIIKLIGVFFNQSLFPRFKQNSLSFVKPHVTKLCILY